MIIPILLSLMAPHAFAAKPKFHCYALPQSPVFAYQSNIKCKDANGDDMTVVCQYQAACKVASFDGPPPEMSGPDIWALMNDEKRTLKHSLLICKGKAQMQNGSIISAQCPPATECQRDGFFEGIEVAKSATVPVPLHMPKGKSDVAR